MTIVATAGTRIDDVSLTLTRGAAIAGVIRDTAGLPVLNAIVSALRLLPDATLATPVTARADDRGAYRIFGLGAGSYVVSASRPPTVAQGDIAELSAEAIDRKLEALRARRATAAGPPSQPQISPAETTSTYVPVFHPQAYSRQMLLALRWRMETIAPERTSCWIGCSPWRSTAPCRAHPQARRS